MGLRIYNASAGSGKTYRLALEYIALLAVDPKRYRHILAITFTNKATDEMKERILRFLHDLSTGKAGDKIDPIAGICRRNEAELPSGFGENTIRQNCRMALDYILHDYSSFSISTIDSFFQRVIRAFARELNLSAGFNLELDTTSVKQKVVDSLYLSIGSDPEITDWLEKMTLARMNEGERFDARQTVEKLCAAFFEEKFQEVEKYLIADEEHQYKVVLEKLFEKLNAEISAFRKYIQKLGKEGLEICRKNNLVKDDFNRGQAYKMLSDAAEFSSLSNWSVGKTVLDNLFEGKKWSSGKAANPDLVESVGHQELQPLMTAILERVEKDAVKIRTWMLIRQNLHVLGLVYSLREKIIEYRKENNTMLISDASKLLREVMGESDVPFIYEKFGTRFEYFLLDEFQDTSNAQWHNLRPLISQSDAEGKTSLLVGDIKQSIYRWRGGDMNLLMNQVSREFPAAEKVSMENNFRSRENIVWFNNIFYPLAADYLDRRLAVLTGREPALPLCTAYAACHQQSKYGCDGSVEIQRFENKGFSEASLNYITGKIAALLDEGWREQDICILTRSGPECSRVADWLSDPGKNGARQFRVLSQSSLEVGHSPRVNLIIRMARFIAGNDDALSVSELLADWFRLREEPVAEAFDAAAHQEIMAKTFAMDPASLKKEWSHLPVYDLVEKLADFFKFNRDGDAWIHRLLELAWEFSADESGNTVKFLQWWDESASAKGISLPQNMDAIRIQTIHKSKGLAFPIVILPFCNWAFVRNFGNQIWAVPDEALEDGLSIYPVDFGKSLGESMFSNEFARESNEVFLENLNLLYVATTRAVDKMIIVTNSHKSEVKDEGFPSISHIFHVLLSGSNSLTEVMQENVDGSLAVLGDEKAVQDKKEKTGDETFGHFHHRDWRSRLRISRKSRDFFRELKPEQDAKIRYGIFVHRALELLRHPSQINKVLLQMQQEGDINEAEKSAVAKDLAALMEMPEVAGWYGKAWRQFREQELIVPDEGLQRPDLVLVRDKKAVVIDFKTGLRKSRDMKQLEAYAESLKAMGFKEVEIRILYIAEKQVIDPRNAPLSEDGDAQLELFS